MRIESKSRWKRSGPGWEAGCRLAPAELRRALLRIGARADADLVMLLRRRRGATGYARIAGVVVDGGKADTLAAAASRFPQTVEPGRNAMSDDARTLIHWLGRPARAGFALVLARRAQAEPFGADALHTVAADCEWVDDVVDLWWSSRRGAARTEALRAALGSGDTGMILLEGRGAVIETNRSADRLLRRGAGLSLARHRLVAAQPDDERRLQAAITRVIIAAACGRTPPPEHFPIQREPGRRPLAVAVMRADQLPAIHGDDADPVVLIQVADPDAEPQATATSCEIFHLTPAEGRLTEQLVAGLTVTEAAERLDLSIDTARTYLKHVFAKLGVNRQANLVRVVLNCRLPARRPRSPGLVSRRRERAHADAVLAGAGQIGDDYPLALDPAATRRQAVRRR